MAAQMSPSGQERSWRLRHATSEMPPEADIGRLHAQVRFVPTGDICEVNEAANRGGSVCGISATVRRNRLQTEMAGLESERPHLGLAAKAEILGPG
jgi:hypothetical protein